MTPKDDSVYLKEILDAIAQIEDYVHGVTYETFLAERMRQDAVIKQIENIGESASKFSQDFKKQHFAVPWLQIINMRHRVAHDYPGVDKRVVWDTATNDLDPLKEAIQKILSEM